MFQLSISQRVSNTSTVYNGAKVDLTKVKGLTLAKGGAFTISVPAGVLTDFAGNAVAATSKTFTTLAGTSVALFRNFPQKYRYRKIATV